MFGTVLAMLNSSRVQAVPSAAISSAERTKPLSRETTVPAAITALEERMLASRDVARTGAPGLVLRAVLVMRARRTRRTAMAATNSRPTPMPRISQITWLTWAERIGSAREAPRGVPSSSVTAAGRSARPGRSESALSETVCRPRPRARSARGSSTATAARLSLHERDRDRVVEPVGDGGDEAAGGAGQRHRRGGPDPHWPSRRSSHAVERIGVGPRASAPARLV